MAIRLRPFWGKGFERNSQNRTDLRVCGACHLIVKVIFAQNANERMYELFVINYCYAIRIEKNKNTQRYKHTCKQNYHENLTICSASISSFIFSPHIWMHEKKHGRASLVVLEISRNDVTCWAEVATRWEACRKVGLAVWNLTRC